MIWTGRSARADQVEQPLDILQDQPRSLVGGKPPRKTDRERIQVEGLHRSLDRRIGLVPPPCLRDQPVPHEVDQPGLRDLLSLPHLGVFHPADSGPRFGQPLVLGPVASQVPIVKQVHLRRHPRLHVNTVRDMTDRHVLLGRVDDTAAATFAARPSRAARSRRWRIAKAVAPAQSCKTARSGRPDRPGPAP